MHLAADANARGHLPPRVPMPPRLFLYLLYACAAFTAGCTQPLSAAYQTDPGPYPVQVARDVEVDVPALHKKLRLHIAWPMTGGPFPVVVFSHGGGSSGDMYDGLAQHWAAAGYVVILPTHMDSRSLGFRIQEASTQLMQDVIDTRRLDMTFVLDSLGTLPSLVPGLAGKIDAEHVVAAGHSMGGATALSITGLVLEDPKNGTRFGFRDERFDALLLITEPSNSPMMPVDPWQAVPIPVFVATGSKDYSGQWSGPPKTRLYRFATGIELPTGIPHHYLFIQEMNHYLGGAICRTDVQGPPDLDALHIINGASTAFLDAYTKNDRQALGFLRAGSLGALTGGRAQLSER
jgi:predicted dienelactone hydrolase